MEFVLEPWHWFVLGVVLMLSELVFTAFAALWFGVAAIMVSVLLWLFPMMGIPTQLITWVILSILCTFLWFKFIKPLSIDKTKAGLSREATIGQVGMVIRVGMSHEQVLVRFSLPVMGTDEWNCRSLAPVSVGDRVCVVDIMGNNLVVQPYNPNKQ